MYALAEGGHIFKFGTVKGIYGILFAQDTVKDKAVFQIRLIEENYICLAAVVARRESE